MTDSVDFGPMISAEGCTPDNLDTVKQRLAELEEKYSELAKQKQQTENEFGQKRAKFKELFLQKEDELKKEREITQEAVDKVKIVEEELSTVNRELANIKAAVAISEANKEDEIETIRGHTREEISSLQEIINEAAKEASNSTAVQYENERMKLQELNEKYESEVQDLRHKLSQEREGFLSSVTKSFKNLGHAGSSPNTTLETNTSQEQENLEESMRKAQHDAEVLKSVVLPLEEEISDLKAKLREADDKIIHMQSQGSQPSLTDEDTRPGYTKSPSSISLPDLHDVKDPDEKLQQLMQYLKAEKASRTDLEMYVAVLTTQKNVLMDDADKVRAELQEVCSVLEEEKKANEELRQTWQMANDQFLESQRLMMMDMRRMEAVLSSEQQRQIAEIQRKDQEREAQERKVKELEEMRMRQEKEAEERKKSETMNKIENTPKKSKSKESKKELRVQLQKSKSESKASLNSTNSDDIPPLDENLAESGLKRSLSHSEIGSITDHDSFLDSGIHETRSLNEEVDGMLIRISPEKVLNLPSLTEAQMKAITDRTPELDARKSMVAHAKAGRDRLSMEGRRLVSEKEWELLQQELRSAREKLGRPCDMCNNYEAQLQVVQEKLKEEEMKLILIERHLKNEQQMAENKQKYVIELENSLKENAEDAEKQIGNLLNKVQECEKYIGQVRQHYTQSQVELQDQLRSLTESRETVQKELTRLQKENDTLVGKHSKHAQQLQSEDINLPNNLEEMQLLLLKYREEIIAAKVAKEHTEETLHSEILFLKDQVSAEQQEKNTLEETLTQEVNTLQEKMVVQESLTTELEREASVRAETETKLREAEQALKSIQAKSKQLINGLQQQVEEQSNARTQLENEVQSCRIKIQSLQIDLDNSEAVQRDFVKLSQSLQIQLEKIRGSETEVRWQHEEDIDDCSNCKQSFSVTKRKHHCRHCGRIFCAECIGKIVNSGPNSRPAKVCDVCHTILVSDATPYFSSEPPTTPD